MATSVKKPALSPGYSGTSPLSSGADYLGHQTDMNSGIPK